MFKYPRFLIKDNDHFNIEQFPNLNNKISEAVIVLSDISEAYRTAMLVSFLKNHSILAKWSTNNPEFAAVISSEVLPFKDLEALFESGKDNASFTSELEVYIKDLFKIRSVFL
jgi:hypothetical protein